MSSYKEAGLSDYGLQAFAIAVKNNCHIGDHLDAHTTQKVATRAYRAIAQYMFGKKEAGPDLRIKIDFVLLRAKVMLQVLDLKMEKSIGLV